MSTLADGPAAPTVVLADFIAHCQAISRGDGDRRALVSSAVQRLVDESDVVGALAEPEVADPIPITGADELLFEDDALTVMLVHTPPGVDQPPHDHLVDTIIGVYEGVEVHRFFTRDPETVLRPAGGRSVTGGEVISMPPEAVHAIAAAGPGWCRAVHVYLGPLSRIDRSLFHPETFAEEPLEMERYEEWCRPNASTPVA